MSKEEIKIFYSWQSDLREETNRRVIRKCLYKVIDVLEKSLGIHIILDEATRDVSGSPNIPQTIIDKIKSADIFVADISIITSKAENIRPCPNPNVVYELGYASCELGWNRIVMVFNEEYGDLSKDLPFDFDRHRVSRYQVKNKNDQSGIDDLSRTLKTALKSIISDDPPKASENKTLSNIEKQRLHDQPKIEWALSNLHILTLDNFFDGLPEKYKYSIWHFYYGFANVMGSSRFYLYDSELHQAFVDFFNAWDNIMDSGYYDSSDSDTVSVFYSDSKYGGYSDTDLKKLKIIQEFANTMQLQLEKILLLVRTNYMGIIDIDKFSEKAWDNYVEYSKSIDVEIQY